jgi:hypothetical protein
LIFSMTIFVILFFAVMSGLIILLRVAFK